MQENLTKIYTIEMSQRCGLLTLPVEVQTSIFIYAQNPALVLTCRHFWQMGQSCLLRAKYLVFRYGREAALSERSMKRRIVCLPVIEHLIKHLHCDTTADEFWLYRHACETQEVDICRWIIAAVVAGNLTNTSTLLSMAASCGAVDVVDILVDEFHVDLGQPYAHGSALRMATVYNHLDLVKHFDQKYKLDLHFDDELLLRCASYTGFPELVNYLLERGADVHANTDASLASAVHEGHASVAESLLKAGASATIHDNFCARYAAIRLQDISILRNLIVLGGVDPRFDHDWLLIEACKRGYIQIVRFLLKEILSDDIDNIINMREGILLKKAIIYEQEAVVHLLLDMGANVNSGGCAAGIYRLLNAQDRSMTAKNIIKYIVQNGFDIDQQTQVMQRAIRELLESKHT